MDPFGQRFGHLHGQAVEVEVVGVAIPVEQLLGKAGGPFSHGHRLHGEHVRGGAARLGGPQVAVEIGDAVAVARSLPRQQEATQFRTGRGGGAPGAMPAGSNTTTALPSGRRGNSHRPPGGSAAVPPGTARSSAAAPVRPCRPASARTPRGSVAGSCATATGRRRGHCDPGRQRPPPDRLVLAEHPGPQKGGIRAGSSAPRPSGCHRSGAGWLRPGLPPRCLSALRLSCGGRQGSHRSGVSAPGGPRPSGAPPRSR